MLLSFALVGFTGATMSSLKHKYFVLVIVLETMESVCALLSVILLFFSVVNNGEDRVCGASKYGVTHASYFFVLAMCLFPLPLGVTSRNETSNWKDMSYNIIILVKCFVWGIAATLFAIPRYAR